MERNRTIFIGWQRVILAISVVLSGFSAPTYCQTDGTALLIQQAPLEGGTVTPAVGVHRYGLHEDVTLTAVPKSGYQFVYWLGDVSDPTTNTTMVYLDAPKIVIAVFERAEFELLPVEGRSTSAPVGGMFASAADFSQGGAVSGIGRIRRPKPPGPPEEGDFPVPEQGEEGDFPVPAEPIPEPATISLLGFGVLVLIRRKRSSQNF